MKAIICNQNLSAAHRQVTLSKIGRQWQVQYRDAHGQWHSFPPQPYYAARHTYTRELVYQAGIAAGWTPADLDAELSALLDQGPQTRLDLVRALNATPVRRLAW